MTDTDPTSRRHRPTTAALPVRVATALAAAALTTSALATPATAATAAGAGAVGGTAAGVAATISTKSANSTSSTDSPESPDSPDSGTTVVGTAETPLNVPDELLPDGIGDGRTPPSDPVGAGIIVADYLGDAQSRDALLAQLPEHRRAEVRAVVDAIHAPVPEPDYSDPTTHLTVLGGGVDPDGTLPTKVVQRLDAALAEAEANPDVPILVTGGDTGTGVTEASAMRAHLIDHGIAADRIVVEDRSWTTLSNAAESRRLLPDVDALVLVTSQSHVHRAIVDFTAAFGPDARITGVAAPETPAGPDLDEQRDEIYRDALLWHLLPESVIVDGVPPVAGPGVERNW
ncbi:YdcF family protein [uncultured Corynebacterium sp.]|uniref:YdcF family protein n=1 Tax=uncultured Corynebacterium sp. TaxID=159447 RepID=UPI0025D99E0B|nr:YdcF family protein [uncultured Corynebacterium sp.]